MSHSIRVVLKSGYSFSFICDSMKTKSAEGELLGCSYERATANRPMFIRIDNVDAIIDEGEAEEETNHMSDAENRAGSVRATKGGRQ